ncbi:MAG: glycosyltransferase family 4 protein [Elusimicrobia bacterium]|nr:glycosyltransferase family 4 protein [Elusimicrobiota bacterium]
MVQNQWLFFCRTFSNSFRLGEFLNLDTRFLFSELQDRFVAKRLDPSTDVVFAESLLALNTIRKAKQFNIPTVIDRTNSHIEAQSEIMREEYLLNGLKKEYNSPAVIEKSLKEYAEADYISVLSSFVKKTFLEKGVREEKLLLIPSGVEMDKFVKIGKTDQIFRIIYCGGICLKKGVHYLLRAFHELKLNNAELLLIGRVFPEFECVMKQYSGVYKHIEGIPRRLMHQYYSQGSVLVLPSLEEGLAKVLIEAMACGLPVIATKNTGAEDVLRNGKDGFIVPIRDVEAMKEKILFFYKNPAEMEEMGRNSSSHVRIHFSTEAYVSRLIDSFTQIVRTKRTQPQTEGRR